MVDRRRASGEVGIGGHPQVDGLPRAGLLCIEQAEFVLGSGEADLESFDLAKPSFAFGFGDPGEKVVADLREAASLGRVGAEYGATDACVFVDTGGAEGAGADADGELASFEVAEEDVPFLGCGGAVSSLERRARRRVMNARWA
ncbi:hypothetical protein ACH47C_17165 [Streptomyces rishiriensis]|uniref:hypothetical protein n=1 Tax=Streptomyces rishiriensis TaxID=68264 RepID=UPI0033C48FB5